jgi:hypothetical protein
MKKLVSLLFVILTCTLFTVIGSAQSVSRREKPRPEKNQTGQYGETERTETEEWVLQQFNCGCPADLLTMFPNERDRVISGFFLSDLLRQSSKENDKSVVKGLFLKNATVTGDFYLQDAEVANSVSFENCKLNRVDFINTMFRRGLTLRACSFMSFEAPEEIEGDLALDGSTINGPLHIYDCRIHGAIYASGLTVAGVESDVDVSGIVTKRCDFRDCRFEGQVILSRLRAGAGVDFAESKFESLDETRFDEMAIHDDFDISWATFAGPVTFTMSHVGGNLMAVESVFAYQPISGYFPRYPTARPPLQSAESIEFVSQGVSGLNMQISGDAVFTRATFIGATDLTSISIGRDLEASDVHFACASSDVSFNKCKIGGGAYFGGSTFAGGIDIADSDVGKSISFDDGIADGPVTLSASRIGGAVSCDRARFGPAAVFDATDTKAVGGLSITASVMHGPVSLQYFETRGDVRLDDTWFMDKAKMNLFEGKFGRNVSALRAHFAGYIDAFHITVSGSMDLTGAWIESPDGLFGETADIKTKLILSEVTAAGDVDFAAATAGSIFCRGITFLKPSLKALFSDFTVVHLGVFEHLSGHLILQDSRFGELSFEGVSPQTTGNLVNLMGTKFGLLSVNGSDQSKGFLDLLSNCEFHVSTYAALEQYLKAAGRSSDADDIFVAARRAEADRSTFVGRVCWWLLDVTTGYGRHMERLVWWLLGFVGMGTWVFWDRNSMRPKDTNEPHAYNPFWYSLGLFLPFDNLGISREWVPMDERRFARHYVHVQQLAGWLLVSVGIGALLGFR